MSWVGGLGRHIAAIGGVSAVLGDLEHHWVRPPTQLIELGRKNCARDPDGNLAQSRNFFGDPFAGQPGPKRALGSFRGLRDPRALEPGITIEHLGNAEDGRVAAD
jgi:hypothetical protein